MKRQAFTRRFAIGVAQPFRAAILMTLVGAGFAWPAADPFDQFFAAADPRAAAKASERLLKDHIDFDTLYARLKAGRRYGPGKPGTHSYRFPALDGASFDNEIEIPAEYDPARRWPVRVQLHGGINRPYGERRPRRPNSLRADTPQIYVYPRAWSDAPWWQPNQVANILRLVDKLKRDYNVDESLVYITGFSDGGTGAYFFGMREVTLFSSVLPLHGHIGVLENPSVGADGRMFTHNLGNRPLFITNGGVDPLYPVARTSQYIDRLQQEGVALTFRPLMNVGHDTSWWPSERATIERFVAEHPREAHPARLSWETDKTDRYNRIDWLVIEKINGPSGRVDVVRRDNAFDVTTRGVRTFQLLLSPDAVNFSSPVTVTVNGREAFKGSVAKDPAVLLKWAARDNDRTRLYAAELTIEVP